MPRRSADDLITAAFLPKLEPIPEPRTLQPARARQIWKEVVQSKPVNYFQVTDTPLLTRFCTIAARCEAVEQLLAVTPADAKGAPQLERRLASLAASLAGLAQKLRLTVAHRIERHAAARSEVRSWPPPWHDGAID